MINKILIFSVLVISTISAASMLKKKEIEPGVFIYVQPTVLDFNSCASKKDCENFQKASQEYDEYFNEVQNGFHASTMKRLKKEKKSSSIK